MSSVHYCGLTWDSFFLPLKIDVIIIIIVSEFIVHLLQLDHKCITTVIFTCILHHYLYFNAWFWLTKVPCQFFIFGCSEIETSWISSFLWIRCPSCYPANKHWKKLEALISTRENHPLALSFLHPLLGCWGMWCCFITLTVQHQYRVMFDTDEKCWSMQKRNDRF